MVDSTIPFDQPDPGQQIAFDTQPAPSIPAPRIPTRAAKADFALGDSSPGVTSLQSEFSAAGDQRQQQISAQHQALEFEARKQDVLDRIIATQKGKVTPDEASFVVSMDKQHWDQYNNPEDALETQFAHKFVTSVAAAPTNQSTYQDFEVQDPEAANSTLDVVQYAVARNQISHKVLDDVEDQRKQQTWYQKGLDVAATMVPLSSARLNNLVQEAPATSLLPGNNLQEQIDFLHSLPPKPFGIALRTAVNSIGNLALREQFITAVIQHSDGDAVSNNLGAIADVATIADIAYGIGEGAAKAFDKAAVRGSVGATEAIKPTSPLGGATRAITDDPEVAAASKAFDVPAVTEQPDTFRQTNYPPEAKPSTGVYARSASDFNQYEKPPRAANAQDLTNKSFDATQAANDPGAYTVPSGVTPEDYNAFGVRPTPANDNSFVTAANENRTDFENYHEFTPTAREEVKQIGVTRQLEDKTQAVNDPPATNLARSIITSSKPRDLDLGKIAETTGDLPGAAVVNATKEAAGVTLKDEDQVRAHAMSINGGGNRWFTGQPAALARNLTDTLVKAAVSRSKIAEKILSSIQVSRDSTVGMAAVQRKTLDDILSNSRFPLQSAVLDIEGPQGYVITHHPISNTQSIAVSIGRKDGQLFGNRFAARKFFEDNFPNLKFERDTIQPHGGKYYIRITKDLPDSFDVLDHPDMLIDANSKYTNSWIRGMLPQGMAGYNVRNILGKENFAKRITVASGIQGLYEDLRAFVKPIGQLTKSEREDFNVILAKNRDYVDKVSGDRGMYYKTEGELRQSYVDQFKRQPNEKEIDAYFNYVQNYQLDGVIRKGGWARDKIRHGIQEISDKYLSNETNVTATKSLKFEGKRVDDIPWKDGHEANIAFKQEDGSYKIVSKKFSDIQDKTTPVAKGSVRWYHGGMKPTEGGPRWITTDENYARYRGSAGSENKVHYVDIKHSDFEAGGKLEHTGGWDDLNNFYRHFEVPESYAKKLKPVVNTTKKEINEAITKGHRVYQTADSSTEIGGKVVDFVVTPSGEEGRISLKGPNQDGAHVIYDAEHYIKQPVVKDGVYIRDRAVATAPTKAIRTQREEAYNTARQMLNHPGLDGYVSRNIGEGMTGDDFKRLFQPSMGRDGLDPGFDPKIPFVATNKGERTIDKAGVKFLEGTRSPYNLLDDMARNFAGKRDEFNIPALMDEAGVKHIHNDGALVNPLEAMLQASTDLSDIRLKRDYAITSANQWVAEYHDLLKPTLAELKQNTLGVLQKPEWKEGIDKAAKVNAEAARQTITRFISTSSKDDTFFNAVSAQLADFVKDLPKTTVGGVKGVGAVTIDPARALPFIRDPGRFARSFVFNLHTFFNPATFLTQVATHVNILGISPKHGLLSSAAYFPTRAALINPDMLEHSAGIMSKFGWNPDEYKEMVNGFQRTAWDKIHGNYGLLDAIEPPSIIKTTGGSIMDASKVFFNEGEKSTRIVGFATAYREWKAVNRGAKLTDAVLGRLTARADDLTGNMSAANNEVWQKGLVAVPAQFMSFIIRQAEQYMGSSLTGREKIQLFGAHALFFGLPTALGGVAGIWPIYDQTKKYLVEHGISYDDSVVKNVLMNGMIQPFVQAMTGREYNIGNKFGVDGVSQLRDLIRGDKTLMQMALGASDTPLGGILQTTMDHLPAMWDMASGKAYEGIYPVDTGMFNDYFKNVKAISQAEKLYHALNTQRWMDNNGKDLESVTDGEAITMALSGVETDNMNTKRAASEVMRDSKQEAQNAANIAETKLTQAIKITDPEERWKAISAVKVYMIAAGMTQREISRVQIQMVSGFDQTQVDEVFRHFAKDSHDRSVLQDNTP